MSFLISRTIRGRLQVYMTSFVCSPSVPVVLKVMNLMMAALTEQDEIIRVQGNGWISHVLRCQRSLVVHLNARNEQTGAYALLAQSSRFFAVRFPASFPCC